MAKVTMQGKKPAAPANDPLFAKNNYILMAAGLAMLFAGFTLMAGGKSADPRVFNEDEIYSFTRITLAPILIILGFVIEIVAIMSKPKTQKPAGNDTGLV